MLWSWWMVSLVVAAAYSGTLTAFLSVSKQPPPFSSPQDLLTTDHHYTWGTFLDSVQMFILKVSKRCRCCSLLILYLLWWWWW